MTEPARPIDVNNIMSARGVQLLRSVRLTFELIAEHRKEHASEYSTINAAIASHLRSSDPIAAQQAPSIVEMPVVASPAVPMFIYEPAEEVAAQLHDGAEYIVSMFRDRLAPDCIGLSIRDALDGHALLYMTPEQVETLRQGLARVLAAVRK